MFEILTPIAVLILAITVIFQGADIIRLRKTLSVFTEAVHTLDDYTEHIVKNQAEFDERLTKLTRKLAESEAEHQKSMMALTKKMEKAEDLIDAHTEMEKEAAKLEREWQEGLNNLLNYEVMK